MAQILTTKEMARYLKLHEITVAKYAAKGEIPAIRIGRVWRFDKEAVDEWIRSAQGKEQPKKKTKRTKSAGAKAEGKARKPRARAAAKADPAPEDASSGVVYKLRKKASGKG